MGPCSDPSAASGEPRLEALKPFLLGQPHRARSPVAAAGPLGQARPEKGHRGSGVALGPGRPPLSPEVPWASPYLSAALASQGYCEDKGRGGNGGTALSSLEGGGTKGVKQ